MLIRKLVSSDRIQRCRQRRTRRARTAPICGTVSAAVWMAWDGEGAWHWWRDDNAKPWTGAEKRPAWAMKQREAERAPAKTARNARHLQPQISCACARINFARLSRIEGFPTASGLVDADGTLHIPMRDYKTNELLGSQRIYRDGDKWVKKMTPGMRAKVPCCAWDKIKTRETWLVEGYATGLSTQAALKAAHADAAVLVCFQLLPDEAHGRRLGARYMCLPTTMHPNLGFPSVAKPGKGGASNGTSVLRWRRRLGMTLTTGIRQAESNPLVRAIMGLRQTRAAA